MSRLFIIAAIGGAVGIAAATGGEPEYRTPEHGWTAPAIHAGAHDRYLREQEINHLHAFFSRPRPHP